MHRKGGTLAESSPLTIIETLPFLAIGSFVFLVICAFSFISNLAFLPSFAASTTIEFMSSFVAAGLFVKNGGSEPESLPRQLQKMEENLEALNEWAELLHKARNNDEIIKHTLDALEHTLGFEFTAFGLVKRNSIKIEAYRGYHPFPEDLQEVPLDGSGITVKAVNTGDIICVKDVRKHQEYLPASLAIRSELAVPIKTKKRVVGVLNVEMEEVNGFDRADVRLLETLASHVAVALKRVETRKKVETTQKQLQKLEEALEALNEWVQVLDDTENVKEIFKHTLDALEHTLGFEFIIIGLKDEEAIKVKEYRGFNPFLSGFQTLPLNGQGVIVKTVNTGKTILVKDVRNYPNYLSFSPGIKSELAVPIKTRKNTLGIIDVQSSKRNGFDRADVRLLETLASHVAVALKRVEKGGKFVSLHELDELRDNFLAMAAHEINTPLTVIKSKAELLLKNSDLVLTAEQKEEIHRLLESVDRLARIVEDFRRISKFRGNTIQVEKKEHLLADTVEKALATFKDTLLEEGIHIIKAIQKPLWVRYDEDLLLQVIQNLLENAIDYAEEEVWIREWEEEGKAWLSIRDDGPGIPEEEQERIFDPFYRVEKERYREDRLFGGTGLGLTICKRIMDAHGGEIQVSSTLGEGTTFTIWLPKRTGVV